MAARHLALIVAACLYGPAAAAADEIHVMTSGGFTAAFRQLAPRFERATGHTVVAVFGGSLGNGPETIPNRLQRGERADIVILAAQSLDELIAKGHVSAGSRVDLARSAIGMAVRAGAPKPDISTVAALTETLLRATSIAYSASASGVYLSTELFQQLGIADRVLPKSRNAGGERVAALLRRGEADIAFQQISELLPEPGIDYVGPLPPAVQRITIFSAGLAAGARATAAAKGPDRVPCLARGSRDGPRDRPGAGRSRRRGEGSLTDLRPAQASDERRNSVLSAIRRSRAPADH